MDDQSLFSDWPLLLTNDLPIVHQLSISWCIGRGGGAIIIIACLARRFPQCMSSACSGSCQCKCAPTRCHAVGKAESRLSH